MAGSRAWNNIRSEDGRVTKKGDHASVVTRGKAVDGWYEVVCLQNQNRWLTRFQCQGHTTDTIPHTTGPDLLKSVSGSN